MALLTKLLLIIFCAGLCVGFTPDERAKILYSMHHERPEEALSLYLKLAKTRGEHDLELLGWAGMRLLERGAVSDDPEILLMCMFGAGVASNTALLPILEKGIQSKEMQTQLAAISFLGKLQDDEADLLLTQALSSPFLLPRLEAALTLARKQEPSLVEHLQSLYGKVPQEVRPLFAQIVSPLESESATRYLRQLMNDTETAVRIEAIHEVAKTERDDLLPQIRSLASHPERLQQEAAMVALGRLKDTQSVASLRKWAEGSNAFAAHYALALLGDEQGHTVIKQAAASGNPFAISMLGEFQEASDLLADLQHHADEDVRLNATLSLLLQKDTRCLDGLKTILITEKSDLGFFQKSSAGKAFSCWKTVHLASAQKKRYPMLEMQTRQLRDQALIVALELPEADFLTVAKWVFDEKATDLVPTLVTLLANHRSEATVNLIKHYHQSAGAPLLRHYCTLALYQMGEEGPYEEQLLAYVQSAHDAGIIRFQEGAPDDLSTPFSLKPEEKSQLLIEAFEALAASGNFSGIEALINAIAHGNPKNRYALAGLLMRTTE